MTASCVGIIEGRERLRVSFSARDLDGIKSVALLVGGGSVELIESDPPAYRVREERGEDGRRLIALDAPNGAKPRITARAEAWVTFSELPSYVVAFAADATGATSRTAALPVLSEEDCAAGRPFFMSSVPHDVTLAGDSGAPGKRLRLTLDLPR